MDAIPEGLSCGTDEYALELAADPAVSLRLEADVVLLDCVLVKLSVEPAF